MRLVFHSKYVSPHHMSFAKKVAARLGSKNFRYIYAQSLAKERKSLGWDEAEGDWILSGDDPIVKTILNDCDILVSGIRDIDLFESRCKKGLLTIYSNERWFKPIPILGILVPGWVRLFVPWYLRMAWRYARLLRSDMPFYYFPISVWAARDMAIMCRWFGKVTFEREAGGRVWAGRRELKKFRMCAYFVDSTEGRSIVEMQTGLGNVRKILWCGRIISVKRVGDIVKAVSLAAKQGIKLQLDIYGHGTDESRVKRLAKGMDNVRFYDPVPICEVRKIMREHDIFVLSSNAIEGWGAVINEAMEEKIRAVGTFEAGASSTLLPDTCLYHVGDIKGLARLLTGNIPRVEIGGWSCRNFSNFLVHIAENGTITN